MGKEEQTPCEGDGMHLLGKRENMIQMEWLQAGSAPGIDYIEGNKKRIPPCRCPAACWEMSVELSWYLHSGASRELV